MPTKDSTGSGGEGLRGEHSYELVARAIEHVSDVVEITDAEGRFQYVNRAFEKKTGWSFEEVVGRTPADVLRSDRHPEHVYEEVWNTISRGEDWRGRLTSRAKDGTDVIFEVFITPVYDDGEITNYVSIRRDITDRTKLETRLIRADRLAAIAQLAAGIGHEINNPLGFISSNLQYLRSRVEELEGEVADDFQEALDDVFLGIRRIEEIVADLNALTQSSNDEEPVDVVDALESSLTLIDDELLEGIDVERDFGRIPSVEASRSGLMKVFFNLVLNAAQAMSTESPRPNEIRISTFESGEFVVVGVEDTGRGIGEEELDHIFEPFYSTRQVDPGSTGLGLSICYGIVDDLGGEIDVDSEPGEGTMVEVRFPKA